MKQQINKDMVIAMKEKNIIARDILRVLKSEIERNEQSSNGKIELSDYDIFKIIKKLVESVKESGEDKGEISILEAYLPKQMSLNELRVKVKELIDDEQLFAPKGLGVIMKYFKANFDGLYNGKELSNIVKQELK